MPTLRQKLVALAVHYHLVRRRVVFRQEVLDWLDSSGEATCACADAGVEHWSRAGFDTDRFLAEVDRKVAKGTKTREWREALGISSSSTIYHLTVDGLERRR